MPLMLRFLPQFLESSHVTFGCREYQRFGPTVCRGSRAEQYRTVAKLECPGCQSHARSAIAQVLLCLPCCDSDEGHRQLCDLRPDILGKFDIDDFHLEIYTQRQGEDANGSSDDDGLQKLGEV